MYLHHKKTTHILKALVFMFIKNHLKKICCFINFLFKFKIYVNFHRGAENRNIQKMIYLNLFFNLSNIEIFCLFVCVK
jgi:hypothetical protein